MNKVKDTWLSNRSAVAIWLQMPGALHAEALARCGYDAVVIDLQHSPIDFNMAVGMIAAIEAGGAEPIVRVKSNTPADIMKLLDLGAYGVIAPMINNAEDATTFASALHYPPHGERSYGPRRPALRFGNDYWRIASETFISLAMIETQEALDNIDSILSVDGIDGVFIGPTDLALALGKAPVVDSDDPEIMDAIQLVLQRAHKAGKRAGIFCGSGAAAKARIKDGFDFVSVAPDLSLLTASARGAVAQAREGQRRSPVAVLHEQPR